ncbi:aminopeptidase YpdF [Peptococcaceae bacterium CEB3]|nr:aminopeptidase YpdF [Peptococcaceae bacterium CEB3]
MGLERIEQLQESLQANGLVAALIMHPLDVYYYAGTAQPCNLIIPARGEPCLLIRRAEEFARRETWVKNNRVGASLRNVKHVFEELEISDGLVGVTEDNIPAAIYKKIQSTLAPAEITDVSAIVLEQRMVKDPYEIMAIRVSAKVFESVHETIMKYGVAGVKEIELAGQVYAAMRSAQAEGIPRNRRWDASLHPEGIICAGENTWHISGYAMTVTGVGLSNSLAWGSSASQIKRGDVLVADIGINKHGYHADIARTYIVGETNSRQQEIFDLVKAIQERVLAKIRPGVLARTLYEEAESAAIESSCYEYFQGYDGMKGRYVGHGVGLELDEPPTIDPYTRVTLEENMVLAIEPKLLVPGVGGFDLKDTVLITREGYEIISPVSRELFEIGD